MGTRIVALLAVVGGVGLAIGTVRLIAAFIVDPDLHAWDLAAEQFGGPAMSFLGEASLAAIGLSLGGVAVVLVDRIHWAIAIAAVLGTTGVFVALLGAYSAWILLPVGTVAVGLYLANLGVVHWWVALLHAAAGAGFLVLIAEFLTNATIGPVGLAILVYAITWSAIGIELLRTVARDGSTGQTSSGIGVP